MLKRRPVIYVFPFVNFGLLLDKKSCLCRPICVLRFVSSLDLNFLPTYYYRIWSRGL